jgi:hypothetical protein
MVTAQKKNPRYKKIPMSSSNSWTAFCLTLAFFEISVLISPPASVTLTSTFIAIAPMRATLIAKAVQNKRWGVERS